MNSFQAFQKYISLKNHFKSDSYDYFKFRGKTNVSQKSFELRKDKYFFTKAAQHFPEERYEKYLVSNFLINENFWIAEIFQQHAKDNYFAHKKKMESLSYIFMNDINYLKNLYQDANENFDWLFKSSGDHPAILRQTLQKNISLETFIILNKILNFLPNFDKKIHDDIIWPNFKRKMLKYEPFFDINIDDFKTNLKKSLI